LIDQPLNSIKRICQTGLKGSALDGEFQFISVALEQGQAKSLFQEPDLLAHRRLRDVQLSVLPMATHVLDWCT